MHLIRELFLLFVASILSLSHGSQFSEQSLTE